MILRARERARACVCVAADNEEIISTLFSLAFPRCSILQWFSLYSAFVSEHLFLAPLPPARVTLKGFHCFVRRESVCAPRSDISRIEDFFHLWF